MLTLHIEAEDFGQLVKASLKELGLSLQQGAPSQPGDIPAAPPATGPPAPLKREAPGTPPTPPERPTSPPPQDITPRAIAPVAKPPVKKTDKIPVAQRIKKARRTRAQIAADLLAATAPAAPVPPIPPTPEEDPFAAETTPTPAPSLEPVTFEVVQKELKKVFDKHGKKGLYNLLAGYTANKKVAEVKPEHFAAVMADCKAALK